MAGVTPKQKGSRWERFKKSITGSNAIITLVTVLWGAYNLAPLFQVSVKQPEGLNAIFTMIVSALVVDKVRKKDKNGHA